MWAVYPIARMPSIPKPTQRSPFAFTVSASSQPRRHRSSPRQKKQLRIQKTEQEKRHGGGGGGGKQLSGLDVLWAMRIAAAEKNKAIGGTGNKKNRPRKGLSSAGGRREEYDDVDYSNVRPLCINSKWILKLDELEERLEEISKTK